MAANAKKDNSTTTLLMVIIGVLVGLLSYLYVYSPCIEKKETYNSEIDVLDSLISDRQEKISREEQMENEISAFKETREQILQYFPADIEAEDDLLFCKEIENLTGFYFTTKGIFESPIIFYADNTSSLVGYTRVCGYEFASTYSAFKQMVDYINYYKYRRAITDLKVEYDSGILSGAMVVNEYYIVGGGNEYVSPYIPSVEPGNDNPFDTVLDFTKDNFGEFFN